jgi:hypothetical protein
VEQDHHPLVVLFDLKNRLERRWDDTVVHKLELRGGGGGGKVVREVLLEFLYRAKGSSAHR